MTYNDYENLISPFEEYLDVCASDDLYEEDQELYKEKQKNEHKEYCQIFDLAYIAPSDIEYLLEDYLINDVGGSATFVETSRQFFRKFLPWAYEKDYLDPEHYSELAEVVGSIREMEDFLGFFIVLKVETSKNFLKVVGRVMHKLVKWLHEKGYMADDDYETIDRRVRNSRLISLLRWKPVA